MMTNTRNVSLAVVLALAGIGCTSQADQVGVASAAQEIDDDDYDHDEAHDNAPAPACTPPTPAGAPTITGYPYIDKPKLLDWPSDVPVALPSLTEPTSNRLEDLHGEVRDCSNMDLVFSTAGNYHMALRDAWRGLLLPDSSIDNWFYTTSPPISPDQITNAMVTFGNLNLGCVPMVAAGPGGLMTTLTGLGYTDGAPQSIVRNRGNVILVKKGNPKNIQSIWDLGRRRVRVVTSNPCSEAGSFGNYSSSIYNIAAADPAPPADWNADKLFNRVFNSQSAKKWIAGKRIHHREVPWSIAHGKADAGLIFYHLALYAVRTFPDEFEIVPLGGTADDPLPVTGNKIATMKAVRILGGWSNEQRAHREALFEVFASPEFGDILGQHGLQVPTP